MYDTSTINEVRIFHEKQFYRLLKAYVGYFNHARPHQGMQQQILAPSVPSAPEQDSSDKVLSVPLLGGLHSDYQRVASTGDPIAVVGQSFSPLPMTMLMALS